MSLLIVHTQRQTDIWIDKSLLFIYVKLYYLLSRLLSHCIELGVTR